MGATKQNAFGAGEDQLRTDTRGRAEVGALRPDGSVSHPSVAVLGSLGVVAAKQDESLAAAEKLGIGWVNWQVLRLSYATWMVEAGANPKAVQAQMRHSRISTTMDIYAQFAAAAQRRAVAQMMDMVATRVAKSRTAVRTTAVN